MPVRRDQEDTGRIGYTGVDEIPASKAFGESTDYEEAAAACTRRRHQDTAVGGLPRGGELPRKYPVYRHHAINPFEKAVVI